MKQRFREEPSPESASLTDDLSLPTIPAKVRIRTRFVEDSIFVDTSGQVWNHDRYCAINWGKCRLERRLTEALRQFIWHRLASNSPLTANSNFKELMRNQDVLGRYPFPWSMDDCTAILGALRNSRAAYLALRVFYRWAALKMIPGFTQEISAHLDDFAAPEYDTYRSVKLRENVFSAWEESAFISALNETVDESDYFTLRDNVIAHLNWELGLRAEQVAGVEETHLTETMGPGGAKYYHLAIIRLKQRTFQSSYRNRVVSDRLAEKIKKLIFLKADLFGAGPAERPIFVTLRNKRISAVDVRNAIIQVCEEASIHPGHSTFLRHNMAQKLADQGTPGDLISDMLDHTTKIAARHYVAATPAIAKIKARALGKNATYKELMGLMTGDLINCNDSINQHQIVRGVIATRYIGNIGVCGLDVDTPCYKNPIYSCYTCRKFNPFIEGEHAAVVDALRGEVQVILDQSLDLAENKLVLQLEKTIEHACDVLIRCESHLPGVRNEG